MSAALPVPALAPVSVARARFLPVIGDSMMPTLGREHMVAVVPVDGYRGEGLYVLDVGGLGTATVMRCQRVFGQGNIRVWYDNPAYSAATVTREWFEGTLLGKVAAVLRIEDRTLLEDEVPPLA